MQPSSSSLVMSFLHLSLPLLTTLLSFPPSCLPFAAVLLPMAPSALSCSLQREVGVEGFGSNAIACRPSHLGTSYRREAPHILAEKMNVFLGNSITLSLFHLPTQPTNPSLLPDHALPKWIIATSPHDTLKSGDTKLFPIPLFRSPPPHAFLL